MAADVRPLPRLPLDTANVSSTLEGALEAVLVDEPGEDVALVHLLQTPTPEFFEGPAGSEWYDREIAKPYPSVASAAAAARAVMARFA